jgi:hypothetical protein
VINEKTEENQSPGSRALYSKEMLLVTTKKHLLT